MHPPTLSAADLAVLMARAGLSVTPAQLAQVHAVWGAMEAMQAAIRTPPPGTAPLSAGAAAMEPAVTFAAGHGR